MWGIGAWLSQLVLAETRWVLDAVNEGSAAQIASALDSLGSLDEDLARLEGAQRLR